MGKILGKKFFNRGALVVARNLLGKYLIRKLNGKEIALKIKEVETYDGLGTGLLMLTKTKLTATK